MTPPNAPPAPVAHAPETLEGLYVLHQIFSVDRGGDSGIGRLGDSVTRRLGELPTAKEGWTAFVRLIGSRSDVMAMHFRPTLDEIGDAQRALECSGITRGMTLDYSFLSVTEAGLYHLSAQLAKEAAERGGSVGDEKYVEELARRAAAERESAHVQRRLYPAIPEGMPYVCFYPMNKKRETGQNWYSLTLEERSRLMWSHGITGRRYAGRVLQIISGAIGFDAWEWGVTLFAKDPLDFKKLVTEMRFDEASAKYADFGDFYVGRLAAAADIAALIGVRETR